MITDHRYDAGWPRDDHDGCIADTLGQEDSGAGGTCGKPEAEHELSEYQHDPDPEVGALGGIALTHDNPGDMHEPKAYHGALDWGTKAAHVEL